MKKILVIGSLFACIGGCEVYGSSSDSASDSAKFAVGLELGYNRLVGDVKIKDEHLRPEAIKGQKLSLKSINSPSVTLNARVDKFFGETFGIRSEAAVTFVFRRKSGKYTDYRMDNAGVNLRLPDVEVKEAPIQGSVGIGCVAKLNSTGWMASWIWGVMHAPTEVVSGAWSGDWGNKKLLAMTKVSIEKKICERDTLGLSYRLGFGAKDSHSNQSYVGRNGGLIDAKAGVTSKKVSHNISLTYNHYL